MPQAGTADAHVLPIIGEIAAGGPIEAYQDASETMAVPDLLAPTGDAYVLRVRGDSMIEEHIADGDFVLIRPQTTARNGDIVVAQVEENAVTLKRFFSEKDRVRLQPANPNYAPQFYDDVRIQGKLIGVDPQARLTRPSRTGSMRGVARLRSSLTHGRALAPSIAGRLRPEPSGTADGVARVPPSAYSGSPHPAALSTYRGRSGDRVRGYGAGARALTLKVSHTATEASCP